MGTCMNLTAIQEFTLINRDLFGFSYDEVVPAVEPFTKGISSYVKKLEEDDTLFYFIRLLCDKYKSHAYGRELKKEFYKIYEDTNLGRTMIRGEFLDCIMVENNSLPFIGRQNIKVSLQQMLNRQRSRISIVKGSNRTGRSYLQHYLSEIAGKTQRYELVSIDLGMVHREFAEADECLWGSHLAAYIGGHLGLPVSIDPSSKALFKHTPFIGQLRNYIRETQRILLFFFDQFEAITPAMDLSSLILGIADLSLEQFGIESYSFLTDSGERQLTNIPFRLRAVLSHPASTLVVDDFDQVQVEAFFKKVYLYMSTAYHIDGDMESFLANVNSQLLPPAAYEPPNVERIGQTVTQWIQNQV